MTVPKAVRLALGLKVGADIVYRIEDNGVLMIQVGPRAHVPYAGGDVAGDQYPSGDSQ